MNRMMTRVMNMVTMVVGGPNFAVQALERFLAFAAKQPQDEALEALTDKCRQVIPILALASSVLMDKDISSIIAGAMLHQVSQVQEEEEQRVAAQPMTEERRSNAN